MPNSIREQILQALVDKLSRIASDHSATVHRSPTVAIERERCPALVLFPETDQITERPNDRVVRQLTIRLVALARAIPPNTPEPEADALLVAAHAALLSDVNLGGLCFGISEIDAEYDVEDADAEACAIPQRYRIQYRTLAADLSVTG
jgi:hypothetical protein